MVVIRNFLLLLHLFVLVSCATGGRSERSELKTFYQTGAYDQGLQYLDKSKYFQDKNEHLLFLLEKGMFLNAKGEYAQSNVIFEEAKSLTNELYTIRLSKKIEKSILNDNYDVFYGEVYERSLIYFYSSLNSILLYQKDLNRDLLFKARADILGWDSYLNSMKEDRLGKSVYKNDLMLKLYGAKVHELVGTREDEQIALHLYKDAEDVLLKNYNTYPSINQKYKDFKSNFDKLAKMNLSEVKEKFISETEHQKILKTYIQSNINRLSHKKDSPLEKMTFIFQKGSIAEKVADKTHFGLNGLSHDPYINLYVANVLGLVPGPNSYNPGGAFAGIVTTNVALNLFTFGFELPKIENNKPPTEDFLVIKNKLQNVVLRTNIALINPMGDIAEEAVYESSTSTYVRTGARLTTKHIAAIMASFATFKALGGGDKKENFLAKNAAVLQYIAATRAIEESEKADTRYWSSLPNELKMADVEINPGDYDIFIENNQGLLKPLGSIQILKNNKEKIYTFKI